MRFAEPLTPERPLVLCVFVMTVARGQGRYSIPEEMTKGSLVGNIVQDLGLDVKRLKSGRARIFTEDSREYIGLNVDKGTLLVKERIDREELCAQVSPCSLHFQIILENPMELHRIDVEILDINDHAPVFMKKEITFQISESAFSGARYSIDSANDPDVGLNSIQTYKLTPSDHFTVKIPAHLDDTKYVEMILQKTLDRETGEEHKMILTAFDGGNPQKTGTIKINVIVLDANDNAPVFSQSIYKASIPENFPKGSSVLRVSATDKDVGSNGDVTYSFSQSSERLSNLFQIDSSSGDIIVNGQLDFEKSKKYELYVEATDKGGLSDTSKVHIEITDINDNAPIISVISFSNPVAESSAPETVIAMLNVKDLDSGKNGIVRCYIAQNLPFKIKSSSPNFYSLVTDELLDREKVSEYNITITAIDEGSPSFSTNKTLTLKISDLYRITIEILDVNDNSPAFPRGNVTLEISESASTGARFTVDSAVDPDVGINSIQSYSVHPTDHFTLKTQSRSGSSKNVELVLQTHLDREKQDHLYLTVTATDGGNPKRSGTVKINIIILDNNDNAPIFQKDTYRIYIPENIAKGSLLVTVNATDADIAANAQIGYYFEHTTPKIRDLFSVDPSSGEIRLIGELDFEESAIHEFKIQAKDQGGLSDSSEVIVEVTDVNDNAPKMTLMSFSNNIPENAPLGTVVAMINIQDSDSEENGKITCFIDRDLPFKIESSLTNYYSIFTDSELDREDIPEYNITITAKDSGSPSLFSKKILNVKITDVNDHAPQFEQDSYNAYVMENNSPSLSLFSVKAHDADLGANARVSYFISDNDLNGTPISSLVSINSESGTVYATKSFDYEQLKSFTITVKAQDAGSPPLSSNVSVKITIQDQNDNAPQVLYPVQSGASVVAEIVPRSADVGYLVTKVVAVDVDSGQNAWLSYKLQKATDRALFEVGLQNGEIRTVRQVTDKDAVKQRLTVVVEDNGQPSRSATVNVNVAVADSFPEVLSEFTDFTHDKDYNDNLTFYLVLALAVVSFLFIVSIIAILSVKCYRWRRERMFYKSGANLPVIPYYPPLYADVGGTGTLQHVYNYEVCRTTDSRKSDLKFLKCALISQTAGSWGRGCVLRGESRLMQQNPN
uniref:Cadherin domain-containing protein n=1 Tax=Sinocyclocheilus rhinocerous TaxID=307959 RepID=A0A673L0R6_9TELE